MMGIAQRAPSAFSAFTRAATVEAGSRYHRMGGWLNLVQTAQDSSQPDLLWLSLGQESLSTLPVQADCPMR